MDKIKKNDYNKKNDNKKNDNKKNDNKKNENKKNDNKKNENNIVVKKELNYDRINKIVKKSKNSKKDLKGGNLKIIKIILLHFHHKIKRTAQNIFDL